MASHFVQLVGTVKWAKVFPFNKDTEYGPMYTLNLYPNASSWVIFDALHLNLKKRTDEDGEQYIILRRPESKEIKNEEVIFGPPEVTKDGESFDNLIGNGSEIAVVIVVYDYNYKGRPGKSHRLESVDVLNWVEYVRPEEETSEEDSTEESIVPPTPYKAPLPPLSTPKKPTRRF